MKHTALVGPNTLDALEAACVALRVAGAPGSAEVRVRSSMTVSPDGGLPRSVTGRWHKPEVDEALTA